MHLLYCSLSFYMYSLFLYFPMFPPLWQVIPYLFFEQFLLVFFKAIVSVGFDISSLYHQFAPIYNKYCLPLKSIELFGNVHGNYIYMETSFCYKKSNGPKTHFAWAKFHSLVFL